jgi:hypothetical protein
VKSSKIPFASWHWSSKAVFFFSATVSKAICALARHK